MQSDFHPQPPPSESNVPNPAGRTVLVIELSTSSGKIAVVNGGAVLFSRTFHSERSHNAQLFGPLGDALAEAGDALDLIVVGTGPGSYTGVRIAIAAAQGVSLSRAVPVIGISSTLVPEGAAGCDEFCFVGDARRNSFYAARIRAGAFVEPVHVLSHDEFRGWLDAKRSLPAFTFEKTVADACGARLATPCAESLARHARHLTPAEVKRLSSLPLEPFYVREAFITTPKRPWLQV
ncbi:MAG: tRNA (adenosine(37)-N6)-threonylcarbamoyltransferase complex dimerization subunit type 1 TsaB [Verrucomicrobiaceae bacterium]|nr:tRNA (adenosine(37)-N6)-threonylcarbamoyltransferase complex dimerization subunit type 1 TsaB [Verrucomicrobiaceae bacterium]